MGLLGQRRADILKFSVSCKFSQICLLGQKRGHIFKFAIFLQNSVRNNELLEISVVFNSLRLFKTKRSTENWLKLLC